MISNFEFQTLIWVLVSVVILFLSLSTFSVGDVLAKNCCSKGLVFCYYFFQCGLIDIQIRQNYINSSHAFYADGNEVFGNPLNEYNQLHLV